MKKTVRIVHKEGHAALVEWVEKDVAMRAVVPRKAIEGEDHGWGKVDKKEIEAGMPYGDDFTQVEGVTPELVEELKKVGVWTKEDFLARSHLARRAIQQALVVPMFAALIKFAKED